MREAGSDIASEFAPADDGRPTGDVRLAVANAVVRLYKRYYGKGPTRARAYYQDDVVTCVLREVYTRAERTLIASGRSSSVLATRRELQQVIREEFVSEVERITGRKVIGFLSANQEDPDMSVET